MLSTIKPLPLMPKVIALGGLLIASSCWAGDSYLDFVSLNIGSAGTSTAELQPASLGSHLAVDSGQSFSLGYGFQERQMRILLELNQLKRDAKLAANTANVTSNTLFYNVFWVPSFQYNIAAVVGGGVGYSQQKIDDVKVGNNAARDISDTGWSAKVMLGVEYNPLPEVGVQLLYSSVFTDKIKDDAVSWSVADLDHSEVSLGVLYRF